MVLSKVEAAEKLFESKPHPGIQKWMEFFDNGSKFKNSAISGAIYILSLNVLKLNYQCVEGARDVRIL